MKVYLFLALLAGSIAARAQQQVRPVLAELFIETKEPGKFEFSVNDDYSAARSGRYRFYDVSAGTVPVILRLAGKEVLRKDITLRSGMRTLATYSKATGLKVTDELRIFDANGEYALDNWDGNGSRRDDRPSNGRPQDDRMDDLRFPDSRPIVREMRSVDFADLYAAVKRESFDNGRLRILALALRENRVSVNQLIQLLALFSFEDNKLNAAVNCYYSTYDRGNFYKVREAFVFSANRDKLDQFLLKQPPR